MESFQTISLAEIKWSKPSNTAGKSLYGMSALKYGKHAQGTAPALLSGA
jgi:hypothetical protein